MTLVDEHRRGTGGRNQQLALAALAELGDCEGICLLSGGTDGEDGPTDAAGAIVDGSTLARLRAAGIDPDDALARCDAGAALAAIGADLAGGPTGVNHADLVVVVRERRGSHEPP